MDWEEIKAYLQTERPHHKFPILPCQQQLFHRFNQTPKLITYDNLIRKNFELPKSKSKHSRLLFGDLIQGHCGSDVLAYYLSFHGNKKWGIYIIDAGVDYLASEIMKLAPRHKIPLYRRDAEYLAKHNLLLHELGHHAVEIVHTLLAWDYSRPDSYKIHIDNKLQQRRHPPKGQTLHNHEEAVCNWNVIKNKLNFEIRAQNHINTISDFMLTQPLGYKDFGKITAQNYLENIMDAGAATGLPKDTKSYLKKQFRAHSKLDKVKPLTKKKKMKWTQVPIYLIRT